MAQRLKHALLTFAAVVFLIEAWLWDKTILLGRWVARHIPWQEFKDAVTRLIERLPPYGALLLFLIPIAVIEPLKIVAVDQIAHGHLLRGALAFVVLKFVGLGLIAFIFDLTREKLLTIGWFARFYAFVIYWRDKAHDFVAPYKAAVIARLSALKRSIDAAAGRGGVLGMLARLRARVRKAHN
jgi:hypothetical protein